MIEFLRFLNYMLYQSNMFQRYKQKAFLTVEETTHKKVMNPILKFKIVYFLLQWTTLITNSKTMEPTR